MGLISVKLQATVLRMLKPPHPGAFIRTEILEPRGLSVTAAAQVLQVSRPALSNLLNGKADLSRDMALRVPSYDVCRLRRLACEILRFSNRSGAR